MLHYIDYELIACTEGAVLTRASSPVGMYGYKPSPKYLGILLTSNLSWSHHITTIASGEAPHWNDVQEFF